MAICRRAFIRPLWSKSPRVRGGVRAPPGADAVVALVGRLGQACWRAENRRQRQFRHGQAGAERCGLRLLIGSGFPRDTGAEAELLAGLPFVTLDLLDAGAFKQFTEKTFATDRDLVPKGMLEIRE